MVLASEHASEIPTCPPGGSAAGRHGIPTYLKGGSPNDTYPPLIEILAPPLERLCFPKISARAASCCIEKKLIHGRAGLAAASRKLQCHGALLSECRYPTRP